MVEYFELIFVKILYLIVDITLFGSMTMLCGTNNIHEILSDIPTFALNVGIFHGIFLVPQNTVMDLNNVMDVKNTKNISLIVKN